MNISAKQKLVLDAIKRCPECANNDAMLLEQVWFAEGWSDSRSLYDNLSRVTRPETITRRRRELFNMGLINYTDEAMQDRTEAFKNERDNHSNCEQAFISMFGTADPLEDFPKVKYL